MKEIIKFYNQEEDEEDFDSLEEIDEEELDFEEEEEEED